ncbi:MAG: amylo-alpha-1,6-glucosidase [Cyanosarcina radialis HA8281-LM2]|jgi:glycogen debranching enzyme|nr:amylo-alpha-1,6-glucosidase [Cyanosarcina radialis HA8281-LM2]
MYVYLGRETCGNLAAAEAREWLVTNGTGSYASGTVAGLLTRCYHGLLVAALKPPLGRTILLTKLDEIARYEDRLYPLSTNRWQDGTIDPEGYRAIERFHLEGTTPVWSFAVADAWLQKRIWMPPGVNTTYIRYNLHRATLPLTLKIKALVNYRDFHGRTRKDCEMTIATVDRGVRVTALPGAVPFYVLSDRGEFSPANDWYYGYELAAERDRGLCDLDDNLHAVTFNIALQPGEAIAIVASTEPNPDLDSTAAWELRQNYEEQLLESSKRKMGRGGDGERGRQEQPALVETRELASRSTQVEGQDNSDRKWIDQLILAADQFIVNRSLPDNPDGKTIIAGYHWFTDWGRDTMISLPGLTLATGRPEIARSILRTFAKYVSQGMLPNQFPDDGTPPADSEYNTVDATLWYFEAIRAYYDSTGDDPLLDELFPVLAEIVDWHRRGTRYNIHLDPSDGLIYAGQEGVQLTWMDGKVYDWVVTPRIGKPVEINALWYNALRIMAKFARQLRQPDREYEAMAESTLKGFDRFWNPNLGYCFDVIDTPAGDDASLRPNQIFAVSLPQSPLTSTQQRSIVEVCGRSLLTPYGLRSLSPDDPQYRGEYQGDSLHRDGAYHQGTVWGWLIRPFILAHLRVFNDIVQARQLLEPMSHHLLNAGLGTISEIFDGNAPMKPKGCIAQAWSVAEVLRAWLATED